MQIQITASPAPGQPGIWTPDTLWAAGSTLVEVIDADESPARDKGVVIAGQKIGRAELAKLRKKPGLIVQGLDQTNAVEMTAQIAESNKAHAAEVERFTGINAAQTVEILRLKKFEAMVVEQEQTIADLRARLAKGTQPIVKQPDQQRRA